MPDNLFNSKISWQNPWAQKRTRVLTRVLTKLTCVQILLLLLLLLLLAATPSAAAAKLLDRSHVALDRS